MSNTTYSITFNGVLNPTLVSVLPGQCVVIDDTGKYYVVATFANRAGRATAGVVTFASQGGKAVQIQTDGICDRSVTNIPYLAGSPLTAVRVNAGGFLERADPVNPGDEIVGTCNEFGDAILQFGQMSSFITSVNMFGDVRGTTDANTVLGIAGVPWNEATTPVAGDVPFYDGTQVGWYAPNLGGDATGPYSASTVVGLRGVPVDATAPTLGQVLTYDGASAKWQTGGGGSVTLAGDATGPSGANSVVAIRGLGVSATAPTANQVLTADGLGNLSWQAVPPTTSVTLGGDVTGASSSNTVSALQGVALGGSLPLAGYVLTASGGANADWAAPFVTTSVTMGGDVTGSSAASDVVAIYGASVPASGSLVTGNVLQVNGGSSLTYAPVNLAGGVGYVTGVLPVANLPNLAGGVTGAITSNTVEKIRNVTVSATAPSSAYVLTATSGTAAAWAPLPAYAMVRTTYTSDATIGNTEYWVVGDATTVPLTLLLPGTPTEGVPYYIKAGSGVNQSITLTIDGNVGPIDGQAVLTLNAPYASAILLYKSGTWEVF